MTMSRYSLGGGRRVLVAGALVMVVGCFLPWWTVGGTGDLPPRSGHALDGSGFGILVFISAIASLAVVTLPFAAGRPIGADRWFVYGLVAAAGWLGFVVQVADLAISGAYLFREASEIVTRNPGIWIVAIGLIAVSRAVIQIRGEPPIR